MVGNRYGRLLVIGDAPPKVSRGAGKPRRRVFVRCDCGTEKPIRVDALASGATVSCGCVRLEQLRTPEFRRQVSERHIEHGHCVDDRSSRTYKTWQSMLSRCENPDHDSYERYGGSGIGVCVRWHSFENFLADMGERPEGKTLDRVNGLYGYEPDNCRWATAQEQQANTFRAQRVIDLIPEIVRRNAMGQTQRQISGDLAIGQATVSRIVNRQRHSLRPLEGDEIADLNRLMEAV